MEWILDLTREHGATPRRVAFLYDIGCTMLAGILKVSVIRQSPSVIPFTNIFSSVECLKKNAEIVE
jgi:hypothetical protein